MQKAPRIHKIISGKHVIWFGESNQWIGFELPAYEVYSKLKDGQKKPEIRKYICRKYELPAAEGTRFVDEIIAGIQAAQNPKRIDENEPSLTISQADLYSLRSYLINDIIIEVSYGTKLMEYYIHPALAHLEIESSPNTDLSITILEYLEKYTLKVGEENNFWVTSDFSLLKRRFYIAILNKIYKASFKDWFSRIHASAITDEKQAIILSSKSGSGKSTMATLMQTNGYRVLSDDFVPMNSKDQLAYPVPAALSVKKGSFHVISKYLPDFNPTSADKYEFGHKDVRFLAPMARSNNYTPVPVSSIVFIKYKPTASKTSFQEITAFDALARYHQEAWVDETPENAQSFIDWFECLSFYQLEYSDTDVAMEHLSTLFNSEN